MRKFSEEEFAAYLARSREKRENPDTVVNPLTQIIVGGGAATKGKTKRKRDEAEDESQQVAEGDIADDAIRDGDVISVMIPKKGTRVTRARLGGGSGGVTSPPKDMAPSSSTAAGKSSPQDEFANWGKDFDPIEFVSANFKGDTKKFDVMPLEDLRRLAVGNELKCLALNQLIFNRQEKENSDKVERAVDEAKKDHTAASKKMKAGYDKQLKVLRDESWLLKKDNRNLLVGRNALIVTLAKAWKDSTLRDVKEKDLEEKIQELEEEADELKMVMADKYVDGFNAAVEQVQALLPDLDPAVLAEVDFMKKVEDGRLVSRFASKS